MTEILVLGGGHIGKPIAWKLDRQDNMFVYGLDPLIESTSKNIQGSIESPPFGVETHHWDIVVNALPFHLNKVALDFAVRHNAHYVDLSEDVESVEYAKSGAVGYSKCIIPQCGLAPGVVSIIASNLAKKFSNIKSIKIRVGALPQFPDNYFHYNLTWSVDGLINEYMKNAQIIEKGQRKTAQGLSGLEHRVLNGVTYEEFYTSGGIGTLLDTFRYVQDVDYKTLRYPGHRNKIRDVIEWNDGQPDGSLKNLLMTKAPRTTKDKVVIFVEVVGYKPDEFYLSQETYFHEVYSDNNETAIQKTTAGAAVGVIEMLANGKITQTGFIKQEDLNFSDFKASLVVKEAFFGG